MAKIDLDSMSIEELAVLRDNVSAKLLEKVAARQLELEAELEKLAQYSKPAKKAIVVAPPPAAKPKKSERKSEEANERQVAEAA